MAERTCRPWWLPHLLAAAVVLPATGAIGWMVYSVQFTDDWSRPASPQSTPALALCGMFGMAAVAVGVVWLAVRALIMRESEHCRTIALGCGLGAVALTVSLAEAAAIGMGFQPGRVPTPVLAAVVAGWVYFVAVGIGYWHLSRVYRPTAGANPRSSASG